MQERYDGKCPFQIVVNQHLIQQGYTIISTSAFSNRLKYSRYINQDKTIGQIRSGGFDTVMYDKEERLIGAEVRPELSLKEFQRSLGKVIVHLTSAFWRSRVEEAMIIMPHKNLSVEDSLKNKFNHVLNGCGHPVSMKYFAIPCRIV